MSTSIKIRSIGNSAGLVLPKEVLQHLKVQKGDVLYVVETPNGIELTPYDPKFAEQMKIAERVMREDRDVLRQLAR